MAHCSPNCVIFSSCRDSCRQTTGCTPSTLATTTSDTADAGRESSENEAGRGRGSFDSCWSAFAALSTAVRNRREHDGPLYRLWDALPFRVTPRATSNVVSILIHVSVSIHLENAQSVEAHVCFLY